jgi:hypothetical protein
VDEPSVPGDRVATCVRCGSIGQRVASSPRNATTRIRS